MKPYPHLTEMGISNPQQIESFSVNSIAYTDVLRIVYERPKGSVLPSSKTYKFPRIQKSVKKEGDTGKSDVVMVSDPALQSALEELRQIIEAKEQDQDIAAAIVEELRLLEEDIALRSDYIKALAEKIKNG